MFEITELPFPPQSTLSTATTKVSTSGAPHPTTTPPPYNTNQAPTKLDFFNTENHVVVFRPKLTATPDSTRRDDCLYKKILVRNSKQNRKMDSIPMAKHVGRRRLASRSVSSSSLVGVSQSWITRTINGDSISASLSSNPRIRLFKPYKSSSVRSPTEQYWGRH